MLEIFWTPAALWALRAMPWRHAARVDAAVQRLAHAGEGELTPVYERDPRALRLRVSPYVVRLNLARRPRARRRMPERWDYRLGVAEDTDI